MPLEYYAEKLAEQLIKKNKALKRGTLLSFINRYGLGIVKINIADTPIKSTIN